MSDSAVPRGSGDKSPPKKKAKVWYQRAFNDEWLSDPELKDWIKPAASDRYAVICSLCDTKKNNKSGIKFVDITKYVKKNPAEDIQT